jgi:hypothetical protein
MAVSPEQVVAVTTRPLNAANTKFWSPDGFPMNEPDPALVEMNDEPHGNILYAQPSAVGCGVGGRDGEAEGFKEGSEVGRCVGWWVG